MEEDQPLAAPPLVQNDTEWSSWSTKGKVVIVVSILVFLILLFGVVFYLEEKHPVHTLIGTTPIPPEHIFISLAPHKERYRQTYTGNVFLQMLLQVHRTINAMDFWVCGLLPCMTHKNDFLVSLLLSYLGSCEAWFQMLTVVYTYSHADTLKLTESAYEAVLD